MKNERLSWEEIKKLYVNQWVGLRDIEKDEDFQTKFGIVFYHCKSKAEFNQNIRQVEKDLGLEFKETGHLYTGIPKLPMFRFPRVIEILEPLERKKENEAQP